MSELRDAALTGDSVSILRNGRLGMVDRFTIYVSNLLPSGVAAGLAAGEWVIYAGTQHALTFASQINKVETLRSEMTFGQLLRGLQVYGSKVLDGTGIGTGDRYSGVSPCQRSTPLGNIWRRLVVSSRTRSSRIATRTTTSSTR